MNRTARSKKNDKAISLIEEIERYQSPADFDENFILEHIPPEKIQFAEHYIENIMGCDISEGSIIEFNNIRSRIFAYLVAHIVMEHEYYIQDMMEISPPGERATQTAPS